MTGVLDHVAVGEQLPGRTIGPLTRMDFARFSVAIDDPNRVHLEEPVAAAAGLPVVIGSGALVTSLLTDVVTSWAGLEALRNASLKVTAPFFPEAVLHAKGTVVRRSEAGDVIEVEVVVDDDGGRRIGEGTFQLAV